MPITTETAVQARNDIFNFLGQITEVLHNIIRDPRAADGSLLVNAGMVEVLQKAWDEFQADFSTTQVKNSIFSAPDQALEHHGLYGAQARSKKRLCDIRLETFGKQRTKGALLRMLDSMDGCLDSITRATGLHYSLMGITRTLRNSIDSD